MSIVTRPAGLMLARLLACLPLLGASMLGAPLLAARAQSLDYQKLEGMFDEPVTSSATGKPERLSETAATMDVITRQDIERSGARDLATLLRLLPGVITYHGHNGTEAFSIGAILLNGRELYLSAFGQLFLDSLPVELEEIRQIEVVHGPQSALYGFDAGDGVINIITFDPARDSVDFARARIGDDARRDGAASVTLAPAAGLGIRMTAASDHLNGTGFDAPAKMPLPWVNQDRRSLSANASAYLPDDSHATVEVSHSDLTTRGLVPETSYLINARLQTDAAKADYTVDTLIGRLGALVSYTQLTVPEAETYVGDGIALHDHSVDGRLNDLVKLSPDDSVRLDFEARDETVRSDNSGSPVDTLLIAMSGMWDHRFDESLSMVNAIRYYSGRISQSGSGSASQGAAAHPSGVADNSALIYRVGADDTLRGSFARGLSLPSQLNFDELGLTSITSHSGALADSLALKTWTNTETRLTYDHQFRDWGASARLSVFDQQTDNLMALTPLELAASFAPACNPRTPLSAKICAALAASSGLPGTGQGIEAEIEHKPMTGLAWGANYSIERMRPHATDEAAMLVPDIGDEETVQKLNAHLGYGGNAWSADVRLLYTSPEPGLTLDTLTNPSRVAIENYKPTLSLSPRIGWQPTDHVEIELSAENLWPYRVNALERIDSLYYLTVRLRY